MKERYLLLKLSLKFNTTHKAKPTERITPMAAMVPLYKKDIPRVLDVKTTFQKAKVKPSFTTPMMPKEYNKA